MFKLKPIATILGACLLQACAAPPTKQELDMQPLLQVRHSSDQLATTYYQLGKYHQERGNLDLALAAYIRSIELDSRQLEARNALASIHSLQGRLDEAKSILQQLVTDYPGVAHSYNNLGYIHYLQGNFTAAVNTLQRALMLDSTSERARNNLQAAQTALANIATASAEGKIYRSLPGALSEPREKAATVTANVAPSSTTQPTTKVADPDLQFASAPRPQSPVTMPSSTAPQARMAVVQIVPNVYELKLKDAVAPVVAERHVDKTIVADASLPAAIATGVRKSSRVEVANGNGVTGMAMRMKHVLVRYGIAVRRLTNERPFTQQETKIQYRPGYEQEAQALKNAMRGYALVAPAKDLSGNADIRLVLGKDVIGKLAAIEKADGDLRLVLNEVRN